MAETMELTTLDISARLADLEAQRTALLAEQVQAENAIADNLDGDTSVLSARLADISGRLSGLDVLKARYTALIPDAESRETMAFMEAFYVDLHAVYSEMAKIDEQIAEHQAAIDKLNAQRQPIKEAIQLLGRRRSKASELSQRLGLSWFMGELARKYAVTKYI